MNISIELSNFEKLMNHHFCALSHCCQKFVKRKEIILKREISPNPKVCDFIFVFGFTKEFQANLTVPHVSLRPNLGTKKVLKFSESSSSSFIYKQKIFSKTRRKAKIWYMFYKNKFALSVRYIWNSVSGKLDITLRHPLNLNHIEWNKKRTFIKICNI